LRTKRAASLSVATQIFKLHDAGHTVDEIAAIVGRRPDSIRKFAAKRGVFISRSALVVRRAVLLSRQREDALRRLADDYGTQATEAWRTC
jgi:predicted transcriptional regulator